jgi:Carboxypeptidase regulatory-like domain
MNHLRNWVFLILCVVSLLLAPMYAQKTTGAITGVVTDATGAVVAMAPVAITNVATAQTRTVNTDDQGVYSAPDLLPGSYQITVKAPNFKESITKGVELHVASVLTQNIKLQIGGTTETIEVSANSIQVQTDSAALGEVIDGGQVKELPLNGRSFVQLTQLAPGVSAANNFDTKNKGLQGGVDFSVNGNPTTNNLFLINGANNNDVGSNRTILIYPSIEAIAEFKLLTNSYGAEYGQASGGIVNLITKSGSNDFHGSVFYSGRNDALAAAEYFAARAGKKDPLRRNDFGYSFGGPVKKDKLFFFWSQEWNKETRGITRSACVPTAAERAGDFTNVSCKADPPNFTQLQALGLATGQRLNAVDPAGALLISKYPLPNLATPIDNANWSESQASKLDWRQENVRVDYNLTKANALMFSYTQDHWENPAPTGGVYWGDDIFPALTGDWAQPSKMIVGKWTSQIGTSAVNDVEFAYSNNRINIGVGGSNPGLQDQISAAIPTLYPSSLKTASSGVPTIWGAFGPYGQQGNYWTIAPWSNALDIYAVKDNFSKVVGKHTLKAGVVFTWNSKDEDNSASSVEHPTFGTADWATSHPTGNQLANVLVPGAVWSLSETSTNVRDLLRWRDYEFYFGDTWKVSRNVTLELGARWSILKTPFHPDGKFTSFQPDLYDPTKPNSDACNGLFIVPGTDPCGDSNRDFGTAFSSGVEGPNKYLRDQNYHLIAPRVGIAWDPTGTGNWAIRVGGGQFYQRDRVSPSNGLAANAPFAINGSLQRALGGPTPASVPGGGAPAAGADPRNVIPNSWQWNFTVEHSIATNTTIGVGYVGNHGIHLLSSYDVNAVPESNWLAVAFVGDANNQKPFRKLQSTNFGEIQYWTHQGDATYHALQATFKTRYKQSQLTAAYTWSHSISNVLLDNSSGGPGGQNFLDSTRPWLDRGNSPINRPHIFTMNGTYFLPDLKGSNGVTRAVLGGWELGGIFSANSGNSQSIYQNGIGEDRSIMANGLPRTVGGAGGSLQSAVGTGRNDMLRPLLTGESCSAGRDGNHLYNPAAFTMVGYVIGTLPSNLAPRGICSGPSFVNVDFSLNKNFSLTERVKMQFRLDFFNLFNHPNFRGDTLIAGRPINNVNCGPANASGQYQPCSVTNNVITRETLSPNFGESNQTAQKGGREIQYGLRISF